MLHMAGPLVHERGIPIMGEEGLSGPFIYTAGQVERLDSQAVTQKQPSLWAQETSQSPACSVNLSCLL